MVSSVKYIFSRRIKDRLIEKGFEPIRKREDVKREGFWVWEFLATPALLNSFDEILKEEEK